MIRCYFVHDTLVGFCHQWPTGLLDVSVSAPRSRAVMEDATTPQYAALRKGAESEWVPAMKDLLELDSTSLPVIWDADFLYGPKLASGEDTYVLCEINVSAVWPFPPQAAKAIAEAAVARITGSNARASPR